MSASNNLNIINFKSPFRCILRCLSCCRFPFCRAQQYSYAVIATVQPNPTQPTAAVQLQYWTREGKNDIRDVGSTADLVPDCTWLYLSVPECTWLYLVVPGCTWLYLIVPDCTWLYLIVPDCTWFYLILLDCTWLYLIVPNCTWLYIIVPDCTWLYPIVSD